jgi:DUF4097 and DUF4098 domain-containing protein YvlB
VTDQETYTSPVSITHVIGETGTFNLNNVSGAIRLTGAATDTVEITARWEHPSNEPLPLNVRRSDGGLHVELEDKSFPFRGGWLFGGPHSIEFEITVPHAAQIKINSVSGEISARATGGEQKYKSVSGDIHLEAVGGRVTLTTVSGDVYLAADKPLAADLNTTSGDLKLAAPTIEQFQFRTVSGDARVSGAFATGPRHSMESVSGDLRVEPTNGLTVEVRRGMDIANGGGRRVVAGDGAAQLRFRSLSGDVSLKGQPSSQPSLEILRALERGEIDVEEASRRLEGATSRG